MLDAIVILETMWDWRSMTSSAGYCSAPSFFKINRHNFSGRRLYGWLDPYRFLVTNACPQLVNHATKHGTPDVERLAQNLRSKRCRLILVCGSVAQRAYLDSGYQHEGIVRFIRHPAARTWTREQLAEARRHLQEILR